MALMFATIVKGAFINYVDKKEVEPNVNYTILMW